MESLSILFPLLQQLTQMHFLIPFFLVLFLFPSGILVVSNPAYSGDIGKLGINNFGNLS